MKILIKILINPLPLFPLEVKSWVIIYAKNANLPLPKGEFTLKPKVCLEPYLG